MRKFKAHERTVEKEAKLAGMIESAESAALVLANRLQLEKEKKGMDFLCTSCENLRTHEQSSSDRQNSRHCVSSQVKSCIRSSVNCATTAPVCGLSRVLNIWIGRPRGVTQRFVATVFVGLPSHISF